MSPARPVILVLGPTASGKTALALELAQRLPAGGECICADSMQVYRGMDIGTAKPPPREQSLIPHHVLDAADPSDDSFSVDRWLELTDQAITAIQSRGRWPVVVGGTNLYVQAFLYGMMKGPEPNPLLRQQLQELTAEELRQRLKKVDPAAAERIHLNDRKRTIRALEVFETSGRAISQWQTHWGTDPECPSVESPDAAASRRRRKDTFIVGLEYPVEAINRRINARVKAMIEAGLIEEVSHLYRDGLLGRNAREALGYKQIIEHLNGRCSVEDAVEQIKIRTRRYARQQRTWLKRFRTWPHSTWISAAGLEADAVAKQAMTAILRYATGPEQAPPPQAAN